MKTEVKALLYNAAGHDEAMATADIDFAGLNKNKLLWIDGPADKLVTLKALPEDVARAIHADAQTATLEIFDSCYRFFVPVLDSNNAIRQLTFLVGKGCLITICDQRPGFMDRFVETDRGETLNGKLTPSALAASLLSELLDDYRKGIADIDKKIDKLDENILRVREKKAPLATLATLRRRVSRLRSSLGDMGGTIHALTRPDFLAHIDACDHTHFENTARILDRLDDAVARARETIIGSFDLYTTRVAQDTNQLVKALTIATVITGVIGCAAGIFGMNFDTPFFHSGAVGFLEVTAAMVMTSLAIVGIAIWRRWF